MIRSKPLLTPHAGKASLETRQVLLGGETVIYTLRRSNRRSIGLKIDDSGLTLTIPRNLGESEITATLQQRSQWILGHLQRHHAGAPDWQACPGACLPVLGQDCTLSILPVMGRRGSAIWSGDGLRLTLCLPAGEAPGALLRQALHERALEVFAPRLAHYARQLGVAVPPLHLSNARGRWGSCSSHSGIRLNWRLIHFPPHLIDYVIAHEVAHLQEMNHGPHFWAVVTRLYPDWQQARATLRMAHCPKID